MSGEEQKNTTGYDDDTKKKVLKENDEGKKDDQDESEVSVSNKDEHTGDLLNLNMDKLWPPLAAEFNGKLRSYSDTSPRREIVKETRQDIRSCTSYMHLPHIHTLKNSSHLRDSRSSPHLHQSFSCMNLPQTTDPDNNFPTVSVIALAEARDKDGGDDVIPDDDDVRDVCCTVNDVQDLEDLDNRITEEAIYTWDREFGRTRSLSEPSDLNSSSGKVQMADQRPRAWSLESADKARKPPSRLQFQSTLDELEEERASGTEVRSATEEADLERLAKSSILVLAESGDFETDSIHTDTRIKDSDSKDEVLTQWTRYDTHPIKRPSFCTELSIIDEDLVEGPASRQPADITSRSKKASVLELVDEVTKDVMSNEKLEIITGSVEAESDAHDEAFWKSKTSPRLGKRRATVATVEPTREVAQSYATEIERKAFDKISQWKTDFAVKLEDVLSKGIERKTEDKGLKPVVVNVPRNLTDSELSNLKGDMLTELKRKSNAGELKISTLPQLKSSADYSSCLPDTKKQTGEEMVARTDIDATQQRRSLSPVKLDKITMTKEKITELLQWHDQERERLVLELKKMQVHRESPETPGLSSQVVLDSAGIESVFSSLQVIVDSIFKETILRLRGTLDSDVLEGKSPEEGNEKRIELQYKDKESTVTEHVQTKQETKEQDKGMKKKGQCIQDSVELQATKTARGFEEQKMYEGRIPGQVASKDTKNTTRPGSKQVKTSSRTQEKSRSTQTAHKKITGAKSSSPVHVHAPSFAEHFCHRETCVGIEDDSSLSCECDSASEDEDYTSDTEENSDEPSELYSGIDLGEDFDEYSDYQFESLAGRPDVLPGRSSTNETDVSPSSSASIPELQSTSTVPTSREPSNGSKAGNEEKGKSDDSSSFEKLREENEDFEESDACSEIADLLGVYQVYNAANNEHEPEVPPRPHKPDLITCEEQELKDKLNRQKTRLRGYKRIVRSFKAKNKHLKADQLNLRRQIHEWHDRCTKKEARISELKHEIDPITSAMKTYRKALEDKSSIIERKDKQILKLLETPGDDREQQVGKAAKSEPGWEHDFESKKYLKTIILDKEKVIQELVKQHEKTFQELTKKIYTLMNERDEIKEENAKLKTISRADEWERKKRHLEVLVARLEKALADANLKYEEKERVNLGIISSLQKKLHDCKKKNDEDSRRLLEAQRSYNELKTSSSSTMSEQENEIMSLKTSVDAFKNLIQKLTTEQNEVTKKHETLPTQAHRNFMKAALKEALVAKEDEARRHQQTRAELQEVNQRLKELNSVFSVTKAERDEMIATMNKQIEALENENSKLKCQERESSSTLLQVNELQDKLAQREREIRELREDGLKQQEKENKLLKQVEELSQHSYFGQQEGTSKSFHEVSGEKCLSLAERCARQWREESELQQQELDELRGKAYESRASTDGKEALSLRTDINEIKNALVDLLRIQKRSRNTAPEELKEKMESKAKKEMEEHETFFNKILETKENAFAEILKEKDIMIQILNEYKSATRQSEIDPETFEAKIEDVIERSVNKRIDELRKSIEMTSKILPNSDVFQEVISDLMKINQKAVKQLKECTEQSWTNVKEDVDELKDFTFKMTDAIEKHFYSTHEHLLNNSIDEVIKHLQNESNGVRKSFVEGMQAHYEGLVEEIQRQGTTGMAKYDAIQTSIDGYNRCNLREFHQARRDVLLAAEAVSNTAEELYQIKKMLIQEFLPKEAGQIPIKKNKEVVEKLQTATKPFGTVKIKEQLEDEYSSKPSISKDAQQKGISVTGSTTYSSDGTSLSTTAELANLEGTRLRDSLSGMAGELSRTFHEDDLRRSYQPSLYHIIPSRDSDGLSLRERLQQRMKLRTRTDTDGVSHSDPYATKIAPFWSRDKPSSSK